MSGIEGPKKDKIINKQLSHWYRVDGRLGSGASAGLDFEVDLDQR